MAATSDPVAVLGIGAMGHGIAANAVRAGLPTIVWNRTPGPTRDLAHAGAEVAPTAADAASRAPIVVTMVTDLDAVVSIACDHGVLAALRPAAIWVQMSTIGVAGTERIAELVRAERPDVTLLDAPVAGSGRETAENRELTIFASGPDEARARVTPLFDAVGQRTMWVGPVGAGSSLNVVISTWIAFASEAVASSLAIAHRLGLSTDTVIEALDGGPLVSQWQAEKLHRIARGDFSAQFSLSLSLKNVHLAIEASDGEQLTALAGLAEEWQAAVALGLGDEDITAVARML